MIATLLKYWRPLAPIHPVTRKIVAILSDGPFRKALGGLSSRGVGHSAPGFISIT